MALGLLLPLAGHILLDEELGEEQENGPDVDVPEDKRVGKNHVKRVHGKDDDGKGGGGASVHSEGQQNIW